MIIFIKIGLYLLIFHPHRESFLEAQNHTVQGYKISVHHLETNFVNMNCFFLFQSKLDFSVCTCICSRLGLFLHILR